MKLAQKKLCAASFDLWRVSWLHTGMLHGTGGWGQKEESSKEPDELGVFVMNTSGEVPRNRVWVLHPVTPTENTQDPFVYR